MYAASDPQCIRKEVKERMKHIGIDIGKKRYHVCVMNDAICAMLWRNSSGTLQGYVAIKNIHDKRQGCAARNPSLTHPIGDIASPFDSIILYIIS